MHKSAFVAAPFVAALVGAPLAPNAFAAEFPEKPIRFILPNAAGGSPDTIARILAARLTEIMGQQVVVDNRPGAGDIIAVEAVAKATPDGYTLLQCGSSQTISPALKRKLPYDTWQDFARCADRRAQSLLIGHNLCRPRASLEPLS